MSPENKIPSPCYVVYEDKLRANLELIKSVAEAADVQIILAFKAFAMWKVFDIVKEYCRYSTASSLAEARLAYDELGSKAHTYAPVYSESEFDTICRCSSHITFNSLTQYAKYAPRARAMGISCGLRINPEYSEVETELYNPCAKGSRLGVVSSLLDNGLPEGLEGLHFHTLCESSSYDLEKTLAVVEQRFGKFFPQIKWLNMGGGHLMTREGYDTGHLIRLLRDFKSRYPWLHVILEPGSAFAWRTGDLVATVEDIVENGGIKTAMLNVSFACHMPDCLEMPYQPAITGARMDSGGPFVYRMGGNSCLSGDYAGNWSFDKPLQPGDRVVFEDMIHYTMVKTTMFNGVSHPSTGIVLSDGKFKLLHGFGYEDYKNRVS